MELNEISKFASTTEFPSVQAFQSYVKDHDELVIPAQQPFIVRNLSVLLDKTLISNGGYKPTEMSQRILLVLNQLTHPVAKIVSFTTGGKVSVDYGLDPDLSLKFSERVKLEAKRERIYTWLTDFFHTMVAYGIPSVTFAPKQELTVLGLSEEECTLEQPPENTVLKVFEFNNPPGFNSRITFMKGDFKIANGWGHYAGSSDQRTFTLSAPHGMTISLVDSFTFFSIRGFRNLLALKGEIKIPANQVLKIKDPLISRLLDLYKTKFEGAVQPAVFFLSQMVLPLGKTINLSSEAAEMNLDVDGDQLELKCEKEVSLKVVTGQLVTDLKDLGECLIADHRSAITLQPDQVLLIYDLDVKELEGWVNSTDITIVKPAVCRFLAKRHPVGFTWSLGFNTTLAYHHAVVNNNEEQPLHALKLHSPHPITLSLQRAPGDWLVLNILNSSSPEVLQALQEGDTNAFIFILFKALFYYCCDDFRHFRTDELPEFFKETTQAQIVNLLKEDASFANAIRLVVQNEELSSQLSTILKSTPDQFMDIDKQTLPGPLKELMIKLLKVTYDELYGSPFISKCVLQANQYLKKTKTSLTEH